MEFTPEQQAHIDNLLSEKTQGLFTQEDLDRKVTSEVDRRVESGIQKGLETNKAKWERELSEKAKLSAEELVQKELDEKMQDLSKREREILKRANTLDAKDLLANAEIPKAQYEKFIGLLVNDDSEATIQNVNNFIETFNETKTEIESNIKKQYSQVPPPKSGQAGTITKAEFSKMGYAEMMELKNSNPDLYKSLIQ